ncbi:MAG: hypothetical protein JW900_02040 [Anaerolineae bacterium]|nr:hypothetical protein [Anaerolineae bacterium]
MIPPLLGNLRLAMVLAAMLTLPGWAALTLGNRWRQWSGLQRWVVAVGISIAFYPVLFYLLRALLPFLTVGPYKMGALLVACAAWSGWRLRGHWKELLAFDRWEWLALAVVGMTLFTRFWMIRDQPYPAWADSLHHAQLTHLTALQGQLPTTTEPYFPIPLGQYHLGLYALSATAEWLGQVPAHQALLWTAQALNGLCGLGVYLVLDRRVGRRGAVVGAAIVGLISHQPAFYVNWGRFTQVSSQTILLIAWLVTWQAVARWRQPWRSHRAEILWNTAIAALLSGGTLLLHLRVAAFYLPLLALSVAWELQKGLGLRQFGRLLGGVAAVGLLTLLLVAPSLWPGLQNYYTSRAQVAAAGGETPETVRLYYEFPWHTVPYLVARPALLALAAAGAVVGLLRRNKLTISALAWSAALYLLGNTYRAGLPLLNVTNLGAILIMLYLPIGLVTGAAVEEGLRWLAPARQRQAERLVVALVLIGAFVGSHWLVLQVEPYRYFVTAEDVAAMDWIRSNTPPDALFAVNTYFWLPDAPHGTDAGYWIPYLAGRQMTSGTMLLHFADPAYIDQIVALSQAVERLEVDNSAIPALREMGVDYIYVGRVGDFSGPGLDAARLSGAEGVTLVYQQGGVSILRIEP